METYTQDKAGLPTIQKRAGSQLDYPMDWTAWLTQIGDTIASYTITVADGLTRSAVMKDEGITTAWLDGGRPGYRYPVKFEIVTASSPPRRDSRTIIVEVIA